MLPIISSHVAVRLDMPELRGQEADDYFPISDTVG